MTIDPTNAVAFEWHDISTDELDYTHLVSSTLSFDGRPEWNALGLETGDILVNAPLSVLIAAFRMWRTGDLRELALAHEMSVPVREPVRSLLDCLDEHACARWCPAVVVVFRALRRRRSADQVSRRMALLKDLPLRGDHSYLNVASEELRRSVIHEWQNAINSDKFRMSVCGPCGRRTDPAHIHSVSPDELDLTLLRNTSLPMILDPTTYDFEVYKKALLHPKGLIDPWHLSNILICEACRRELLVKQRMPKLCLANWLYYAHDELPEDVRNALKESTPTERLLIARARGSRLSYRFSESKRNQSHTQFDGQESSVSSVNSSTSQRYIKGNILIMPQNSTHLNAVLPPDVDAVRDTVCAVFVGRTKPTKDSIAKLGPMLARKSRVKCILKFITCENPHYACDSDFHGFSQHNLDSIFGADSQEDEDIVPCAMEIGYIEETEAISSTVAGYTERGVAEEESPNDGTLVMENVGYTLGDESPVSYREMKMKALSHCLTGGRFIRSQAGDKFVPDFENPSLLTWMFPHLDPWGIGGFHEPGREVIITMEEQLKYLLELDNSPFERDPDFAFVYYNILQKKAVCDSVRFRVKASQQRQMIDDLLAVDKKVLEGLIARFKSNPAYEPQDEAQKQLLALVSKTGTLLHDLPGTTGYKLKMRNEIRALVNFHGTPAFFITLNPSDVNHPLVRLLSGDNIRMEELQGGQELTEWQRMQLVSRNPGACARFFHTMISAFINVVLRYGKRNRGLLGKCIAYYATVEAQGRGTLHCHMLVWLHGHPSPQQLRDLMSDSNQYQQDMFCWLESLIKCELLGTTMVVEETGEPLPRPRFREADGYVHPSTILGPPIEAVPPETFLLQFASSVNDIVTNVNWHQHTETCWKYLKRGESRTDQNCRMRIDGTTRAVTTLDDDTGSILLRRLHPRIANYNDVMIFMLRANMDIKHIGSGEAAKALIYYVTDYITKAALPAHVGLSALLYAINRSNDKFKHVPNWGPAQHTSALTVLVNSMMARQEISHQQVMSYLVGGGDRYSSHKYKVLHYGTFEKRVMRYWARIDLDTNIPENARDITGGLPSGSFTGPPSSSNVTDVSSLFANSLGNSEDSVTLVLGNGSISAFNQQQDYLYRPVTEPFNSMGLYEFIGMTVKVTKTRESSRILRRLPEDADTVRRGRPEEARGDFVEDHPHHDTHVLRKRTQWMIPVILGDKIPRNDRSDEEREEWARCVITLFIPWRTPHDLRLEDETWLDAYARQSHMISPEHQTIISNMNVLNECRDARDKDRLRRRNLQTQPLVDTHRTPSPDPYDVFLGAPRTEPLRSSDDDMVADAQNNELTLLKALDTAVGVRFRHAIDTCYRPGIAIPGGTDDAELPGTVTHITDSMRTELQAHHSLMRKLKRKRTVHTTNTMFSEDRRQVRPRLDRYPVVDVSQIQEGVVSPRTGTNAQSSRHGQDFVHQVVLEKQLLSNTEQLRAFEIVAKHITHGGPQLLMYIGGVGGTGKSHVVSAILRLFELLGMSSNILVAAPTGAAAILIGGHTIHSLTLLPDKPGKDLQELGNIWDGVDYLILDEISMIGAIFLSQLNARLQKAKTTVTNSCDLPFGGVNVIFTGDFGQLRPVRDPSLYSYSLIANPAINTCGNLRGTSALMGAYLWRQVKIVVLLKINHRQASDNSYANLLSRVRKGESNVTVTPGSPSDFVSLQTRYIDRLNPTSQRAFKHAPIIVGRKKIRDLLNLRLLSHHANSLRTSVHLYHSRDKIAGHVVTKDETATLWRLSSTATHDSLGKLPLFPGMKVMVQENLAITNRVVNGSEGTVRDIVYEEEDGRRYAAAVYVHIPGAGRVCPEAVDDVVPIFPESSKFQWFCGATSLTVTRLQLPLLPAYSYTDYKSQGRSLNEAIVDPASAASLQGLYVMLSRVRSLEGLAILRPFKASKINQRLSEELRNELRRVESLDIQTRDNHHSLLIDMPVDS